MCILIMKFNENLLSSSLVVACNWSDRWADGKEDPCKFWWKKKKTVRSLSPALSLYKYYIPNSLTWPLLHKMLASPWGHCLVDIGTCLITYVIFPFHCVFRLLDIRIQPVMYGFVSGYCLWRLIIKCFSWHLSKMRET